MTKVYYSELIFTFFSALLQQTRMWLVLILDGNLKNSRDVHAAEDARFVEYAGLPEQVKTGCMETPQQSGKFCLHLNPTKLIVLVTRKLWKWFSANGKHEKYHV